jgi:hypothetical protein
MLHYDTGAAQEVEPFHKKHPTRHQSLALYLFEKYMTQRGVIITLILGVLLGLLTVLVMSISNLILISYIGYSYMSISSYVSSYVNSLSSAPLLYRSCRAFKPRSRASLGFFEKGCDFVESEDPYAQIEQKIDSVVSQETSDKTSISCPSCGRTNIQSESSGYWERREYTLRIFS